jgi:transposase-like protein
MRARLDLADVVGQVEAKWACGVAAVGRQMSVTLAESNHSGLVAARRRILQGAAHQRCRVHFARNLLALVPKSYKDMVAAVFRTIFAQPDAATVANTWDSVRDRLAAAFPKIGPLMDEAKTEVLAITAFPAATGPRCGRPTDWNGSTSPPQTDQQ